MLSFSVTWLSRVGRLMILFPVFVLSQGAQAQWNAKVGLQSVDQARQALAFLPNELWIHQGDSITWNFEAGEIHTVTFLSTVPTPQIRPSFDTGCPGFSSDPATFDGSTCVTTPPFVEGSTFTVIFPATGNFKLVCLVHPDMTAVIHVLDSSLPLPHTQDFYDHEAKEEARALLSDDQDRNRHHSGDKSEHHHPGHQITAGSGEITTTAGGAETLSVLRFTSDKMIIHAGQTVEWENDDPEDPHTITFGTEPADLIDPSANVTVDADGARHAIINSNSDNVHSGFILAAPQERVGLSQSPLFVTRFRIRFTHPGTFPYICALHDDLGMKGVIIVVP
jgi:plastocyanin